MRRPRVAPVPTIPDLQLTADRALSLHRPTRWQAQGQLCACRSLSLSLLPEVTSLDLHATEIAADRAMHPSTGSGQALRQAQGRPSPTGWLTSATLRFTDCAVPVAAWPGAQTGNDPPNGGLQPPRSERSERSGRLEAHVGRRVQWKRNGAGLAFVFLSLFCCFSC